MKVKGVVILEDAAIDLQNGQEFYAKNGVEVGRYFFDSLIAEIESLILYAGIHSKVFDLFRMLSKRFPFAIYYQINDNVAYVIAILDMRRNPKIIEKTLKNRS